MSRDDQGSEASDAFKIRFAHAEDARRLAQFRFDFRSSIASTNESEEAFVKRCALWMSERLSKDNAWKCWIAEKSDVAIGNLWLQLIEKVPNPIVEPEYHGYITNVYVSKEHRGLGVGSILLSEAIRWAQAQGLHALILWPTDESRSLYARHGFSVRDDLMELMFHFNARTQGREDAKA